MRKKFIHLRNIIILLGMLIFFSPVWVPITICCWVGDFGEWAESQTDKLIMGPAFDWVARKLGIL